MLTGTEPKKIFLLERDSNTMLQKDWPPLHIGLQGKNKKNSFFVASILIPIHNCIFLESSSNDKQSVTRIWKRTGEKER